MPQITAIETQRKFKKRVSIFIDDDFFCGAALETVAKLGLKVGQEIDPERLCRLTEQEDSVRAREICLRTLDHAPRTRKELRERLHRAGINADLAEQVLDRLENSGVVNDRSYAENWLTQRRRSGAVGSRRMQQELLQRGVSREIISAVQAEQPQDDQATCQRLAEQQVKRYRGLPLATARRRLQGFLARHGFEFDQIHGAIRQVLPLDGHESETLENE